MGAFEKFYCNIEYADKNIILDGQFENNTAKDKYIGVKNGKKWKLINFNNTSTKSVTDFQGDSNIESSFIYDAYYFGRDTLPIDISGLDPWVYSGPVGVLGGTLGNPSITLGYINDVPASLCATLTPTIDCCDSCDFFIDSKYNNGVTNSISSFNYFFTTGQLWFIDLIGGTSRTPCFDDNANGQNTNGNNITGGIDIFFSDGTIFRNIHVLDFGKDVNDNNQPWIMGGSRSAGNIDFISPGCFLQLKNGLPSNNVSLKSINFAFGNMTNGLAVNTGLTVRIESIQAKCNGQSREIDVMLNNISLGAVFQTDTDHLLFEDNSTQGRVVTFCTK